MSFQKTKLSFRRRSFLKSVSVGVPIILLLGLRRLGRPGRTRMNHVSKAATPKFQYELVRATSATALQTCMALREQGRGAFTPVVLDSPDRYLLDRDQLAALRADLPKTLDAAAAMSVEEFFRKRRADDREVYDQLEKGDWPAVPFKLEPQLIRDMDEVFIVKVPTAHSYEAVAYIGFGGWNDCPADAEHVAILRYWHDRYGANLVAQGADMLECTVERPPTTREAAVELAREQLIYALGTLGELGIGNSVPELAAALLNSRYWLFWWD